MLKNIYKYDKLKLKEVSMRGLTYYPQVDKDKIVQSSLQKIEVKEIENKSSFEGAWKELIGLEYGDRYFIIDKNMHDFTKDMIKNIKQGNLKSEDFLYDYPKLFDLFSCGAYLNNTYKHLKLNDLDDKTLKLFLDKVVLSGVNIEEFKMIVLASNLLNIDAMLDQGNDSTILKGKYEFTKNVIELIDMYKKFTPYTYYFRKVDQLITDYSKEDENNLIKIRDTFDNEILKNFADNRIKNCILSGLFNVRTHNDKVVERLMEKPILKEFFVKRQNKCDEYGFELPAMFKYQIDEKGLYVIDDLCKGELSDAVVKNLIDVFKDENLIDINDYNEYRRTKMALNYLDKEAESEQY